MNNNRHQILVAKKQTDKVSTQQNSFAAETTEKLQILSDNQDDYSRTQQQLRDDIATLQTLKKDLEQKEFLRKEQFDRLWATQQLENERNEEAFNLLLQLVQGVQRHQDFQVFYTVFTEVNF